MKNLARRPLFAAALLLSAVAEPAIAQDGDSPPEDGFEYVIPDIAGTLPGLAGQLDAERNQARYGFDERIAEQQRMLEEFPDAPGAPLVYNLSWSLAGAGERLISLAASTYRYDGGAHGNTEFDAKLWDREADRSIAFTRLFTDRYAALSVIDRDYCRQLGAMQRERGIDPETDGFWGECPPLHEQTVFPSAEDGGLFTHITANIGPYVAGPYVVGTFEVPVAVTPELLALVRPEYRSSFALSDQQ